MNKSKYYLLKTILMICLLSVLTACQQMPFMTQEKQSSDKNFSMDHVAKSDIDLIFDYQVRTTREVLRELMLKLYLRNPAYWRDFGSLSAEARVKLLFDMPEADVKVMLRNTRSIESIKLAFDASFQGDRVLAFIYGLKSMLASAYSNKASFYMLDQLDPQKLYDSARNVEVAVWMLSNQRKPSGELFLVSNELEGPVKNLSFERLFGKLIMAQDISAQIVADSTKRTVKNVLQGIARFVLIPI